MAEHTKHPVAAPPTAPARETTGHLLLRGYCILVLFTPPRRHGLVQPPRTDRDVWILALTLGAVTIAIWVPRIVRQRTTNPFPWRRLPVVPAGLRRLGADLRDWSAWPAATLSTWLSLAITTLQGLFMASVLTWREIVRALASALKWVLGLSLVFELWVSMFVRAKLLPNFVAVAGGRAGPAVVLVAEQPLRRRRTHPGHRGKREPARHHGTARDHRVRHPDRVAGGSAKLADRLDRAGGVS